MGLVTLLSIFALGAAMVSCAETKASSCSTEDDDSVLLLQSPWALQPNHMSPSSENAFSKEASVVKQDGPQNATTRAACVDLVGQTSVEIVTREDVQQTIIPTSRIIDCNMVPVGAKGKGNSIVRDSANLYNGTPSYRFRMDDGTENRVELSAAFVTQEDISAASLTESEIAENVAAKSLYHFGKGFAALGKARTYEYGVFLPSALDSKSKGIISQWHGVPDRTTIMDPGGTITKYSLHDFNTQVLSKMRFKQTTGYDIGSKTPNGYMVDQGGYPPVALKVGEGYLYLVVRADHRRVTDKSDRVNISPPRQKLKRSKKKTKEVSSPYMTPLSKFPLNTWTDVKLVISFSKWKLDGSGLETDGSVQMYLNGTQVVDWSGPLGNNDDYGPYFKYGIYKPGATGLDVSLASFHEYD